MNNVRNWLVGTVTLVASVTLLMTACSHDDKGEPAASSTLESMQSVVQETAASADAKISSAADTTSQLAREGASKTADLAADAAATVDAAVEAAGKHAGDSGN